MVIMRKRISRSPSLFLSHSLSFFVGTQFPESDRRKKKQFLALTHAKRSILPFKNFKPIFVKKQFKGSGGYIFFKPRLKYLFSGQEVFVRTLYKQRSSVRDEECQFLEQEVQHQEDRLLLGPTGCSFPWMRFCFFATPCSVSQKAGISWQLFLCSKS